jgi:tetratricopeptide (TPR) repeat protein
MPNVFALLVAMVLSALSPQDVARKSEHQFQMEQQRALELINDSTITQFKQGIDLVRSGKYNDAILVFDAVAKKHPKNSVVYYNLGVTYKFLNNYTQALKMLQCACKLKKDPRYREQLNEVKRLDAARKRSR